MKTFDVLVMLVIILAVDNVDVSSGGILDYGILGASFVWFVCFIVRMVKNRDK